MIIPVKISYSMIEEAARRAECMPVLYNSIRNGDGNFIGCLGEVVIERHIGATKAMEDYYNHDCYWNGLKIEVKTKEVTSTPYESYDCSVAYANATQKCDWYAFVRIMNTFKIAFILGYIEKENFEKIRKYYKAGDVDPVNNFTFKAPCYNIKIGQLHHLGGYYV